MATTPKNLVKHELIGLKVKIKKSTDPTLVGIKGTVVDESYNMLTIEIRNGKEIKVSKKNCVFVFTLPSKIKVQVDGSLLVGRPEDRIKKKIPRW
ncbi:MAG: ribonuclease P protein component 1 [Candidatus Aenigmarchaeota archaeon]|nr:ribonuclease P protein component 1 [Candidatus Aenigmarchaeota archaeon]